MKNNQPTSKNKMTTQKKTERPGKLSFKWDALSPLDLGIILEEEVEAEVANNSKIAVFSRQVQI